MKMRYFLRGLGVGVLLATLLLCISYRGQNSENSIIKQAKELGMQFPEKTPDTLIQPSVAPSQAATQWQYSLRSQFGRKHRILRLHRKQQKSQKKHRNQVRKHVPLQCGAVFCQVLFPVN